MKIIYTHVTIIQLGFIIEVICICIFSSRIHIIVNREDFSASFWDQAPLIFLAGFFTLFVAMIVLIFELLAILSILNIVWDYKVAWFRVSFFQRQNYIFIFTTVLIWFCFQQAWSSMTGLSYGFYIMLGIVFWWITLKFYYKYYKSKLYRRRIINELLKE